ncbi:MAG TPA: hypothetical protein VHB73_00320 [Alphaproteobacteria bacterium]|nr:hypothetical protein [Alphaproteobacteria bacterium]
MRPGLAAIYNGYALVAETAKAVKAGIAVFRPKREDGKQRRLLAGGDINLRKPVALIDNKVSGIQPCRGRTGRFNKVALQIGFFR